MHLRARWVALLLGLPACTFASSRATSVPPARLEPAPQAAAATAPAAVSQGSAPEATDDPELCSDPVEAAYLSACQPGAVATADPSAEPPDPEEIDDGQEEPEAAPGTPESAPPPAHPLAGLSDRELEQKYKDDPGSVGPMSVGSTNAGALVNGVAMPRGEQWVLIDPGNAWGTNETVDALTRTIAKVHAQFPDTPPMQIGHISARHGGHLSPHISHQSGRDVDVSYYQTVPTRWFARATEENLDRPRTWAFVRALITESDVDLILIDRSLQKLLREYAVSIGEPTPWLEDIFDGRPGHRALILHAKGHANHIHVRFYNPVAQETARRLQPVLAKRGKLPAPVSYVLHRARSGDTLGSLARRYGTTVEAIRAANNLRSNAIKAKRVYKIPRAGAARPIPQSRPATPPPRRVPPQGRKRTSAQPASRGK